MTFFLRGSPPSRSHTKPQLILPLKKPHHAFVPSLLASRTMHSFSPPENAVPFDVLLVSAPLSHVSLIFTLRGGMPDRNNTNQPRSNSFRHFCTAEPCQYIYYCLRRFAGTPKQNHPKISYSEVRAVPRQPIFG